MKLRHFLPDLFSVAENVAVAGNVNAKHKHRYNKLNLHTRMLSGEETYPPAHSSADVV